MTDERQNQLLRREIIAAYVVVLDRLGELTEVCSAVTGGVEDLRHAVQQTFELSPLAADAVLALQVRRFTPNERQKIQHELAEIDLWLEQSGGA